MSNLVSCFGRGAAKNARALQAPRTAHALANSGNGANGHDSNDTNKFDVTAALRVNNDSDDNDVPSLRTKLENDIQALEWGTFASSSSATHSGNSRPQRTTSFSSTSSLRSDTAALAARIANSIDCTLDPGTPRYLASAMEDSTPQCRLIVTAQPPFRVVHASPAWESLTGMKREHTEGRPALSVLLAAQSTQLEGVDNLMESLHLHCRGCATVTCRASSGSPSSFPAKVTVSPLIDASGDISHMLCVVRPL
ncbi:hypothetical protein Ndes2526B_g04789 [Nannochloris sp. 'desiccata']|nr:hypothetical protein KSW81_000507 [Chlorella desiccata (nom. nud.)]KAH7620855.1 hypothetical protein NADE_003464 [Chlorella desiccata (nom. nud.)]